MQSILIISKDKKLREEHALQYCFDLKINKLDISIISMDKTDQLDKKKNKNSLGVEDIKNLQKTIHLKPFQSEQKASIIHDAHTMTIEAQNSMLKLLEEPPPHTIIILTADRKEAFLPTILSRCSVIDLKSETELLMKNKDEINKWILNMENLTVNERLKLAEKLSKDKEKTVNWLEEFILMLREKLLLTVKEGDSTEIERLKRVLNNFQKTHYELKTSNVNLRIALEVMLLAN